VSEGRARRARRDTASLLRGGLIAVSALTKVGLAGELAIERHWGSPTQLIAWAALVGLAVAIVLLLARPGRGRCWSCG
jgi:hypothetical protein